VIADLATLRHRVGIQMLERLDSHQNRPLALKVLILPMALSPYGVTYRKLPHLRDKQKVEFSGRILPGGSNEEIAIYGKSDCWDIEGSR
jgi:hypothetical protein